MHDYHLEMSNRFFHILNILFCHFRYVKSHDHEPILSSEYDFVKRPMFLVTRNATPALPAPEMEHKDNFVPPVFLRLGLESFNGLFHRN